MARVRGAVCVFPPGTDKPIWVPEQYVRAVENDGKGSCDEPENDTCHSLDEPPGESQSSGKHCVKPEIKSIYINKCQVFFFYLISFLH